MAVGDYVFDGSPAPPELERAFDFKTWGVNVLDLPPGEVRAVTRAYNAYSHLSSYKSAAAAHRAADWTAQNAQSWEFVSAVLAARMERKRNG